jgi:Restriction endonuclease
MPRGTRSRTPGKNDQKRKLLESLTPTDFPSLIGDILYFSKGHRHVRIMDGPGDGCRDIKSDDKDGVSVLTQCKYVVDPAKGIGSADANEIIVALTKFGGQRGILASTGRFSPQLKREFTDNFPSLHLDWIEGTDVVDEVFSNPILFRVWVTGSAIGRETIFVKIPFFVRGALNDAPVEQADENLGEGLLIEGTCSVDIAALEPFRPPEAVGWSESFARSVWGAAVLCQHPPDLHELERLHMQMLNKKFGTATEVATVRFGSPYLVPTKNPEFEKGFPIPGFNARSYIVRPEKTATPEQDYLLLNSDDWIWPDHLSVAEGDWGNWQTNNNQRWCHIEVFNPAFPKSNQSHICRLIGESKRRELHESKALFITATIDVCHEIASRCLVQPDIRCPNGPGGELLGWTFSKREQSESDRKSVLEALQIENSHRLLDLEDAIHLTSRSDDPIVPEPGGETYYPAQLVWDYENLPSPQYLKGRSCNFIEFWWVPVDVDTASKILDSMSFDLPNEWHIWVDCKRGPITKQTFPMFSVGIPCTLELSSSELVEEVSSQVDDVFQQIAQRLRDVWPDARCATSEFWEQEVRFPAGMYIPTKEGLQRTDWWPDETEEGDD